VKCKIIFSPLFLASLVSCTRVNTDVFSVNNASLFSPLERHGADETISTGPNGSKTISTRIHRLNNEGNGWIIGIRRQTSEEFSFETSQKFVEKVTLYFPNTIKPNGAYSIKNNKDILRVLYSRISPSYVNGCAAEAEFGTVNVSWESEDIFVVNIQAAFDMKYGTFCEPSLINESYKGRIIQFNELTPWLGKIEHLGTFDELHDELRR